MKGFFLRLQRFMRLLGKATEPVLQIGPVMSLYAGQEITCTSGTFCLVKLIGSAMAEVWVGFSVERRENVILKFCRNNSRTTLMLIMSEDVIGRSLRHLNIAKVRGLHFPQWLPPCLEVEFIEGQTLDEWRFRYGDTGIVPWSALRGCAMQSCDGLSHAHTRGFVHRDIKPSNIMIDKDGTVKIIDFGIAAPACFTKGPAQVTAGAGTERFASPQQMNGSDAHPSDDIYSLGVTLYELLTGGRLFEASGSELKYLIENVGPIEPNERLFSLGGGEVIPSHVAATVINCLQKRKETRPKSIQEVKARLDDDCYRGSVSQAA